MTDMNNRTKMITALEKLKQQRDQISARIQTAEARHKIKQRKGDLQRKILVGSYYLEQAHREGTYHELVKVMDQVLTRQSDRMLFDLPKVEKGKSF